MKKLIQYNAPFTLGFSIICLGVYFLHMYTDGRSTDMVFSLGHSPLNELLTYARLLCHIFGNRDWNSFFTAIIPILVVGPNLEERYTSMPLLIGTAATAIISGLIYHFALPNAEPLLGAGGVVYLMFMMSCMGGGKAGGIPLTMIFLLLAFTFSTIQNAGTILNVDNIVGGVCGILIGMSLRGTPEESNDKKSFSGTFAGNHS